MAYILIFLASVFGTNALPHLVKGLTGQPHMTPFQKPSGAVINVLWGTLNLAVAVGMFHLATDESYRFWYAFIIFFVGATLTGLSLALLWKDDAKARGKG